MNWLRQNALLILLVIIIAVAGYWYYVDRTCISESGELAAGANPPWTASEINQYYSTCLHSRGF